jgi:hypothetical protein
MEILLTGVDFLEFLSVMYWRISIIELTQDNPIEVLQNMFYELKIVFRFMCIFYSELQVNNYPIHKMSCSNLLLMSMKAVIN